VTVGFLRVPDQGGGLTLPGGELRILLAGPLPGQGLQPLVDLAVLEDPAVIGPVLPGRGGLEVLEAARRLQLLGADRDRGLPVDPLPLGPEAAGDRRIAEWQRPQDGPRGLRRIDWSWPLLPHGTSASLPNTPRETLFLSRADDATRSRRTAVGAVAAVTPA